VWIGTVQGSSAHVVIARAVKRAYLELTPRPDGWVLIQATINTVVRDGTEPSEDDLRENVI